MMQKPPYRLTPLILRRCQDIAQALGLLIGTKIDLPPLQLRRANNIKTIQASLAIEGNSLGEEQVSQIFDGKRVIGPTRDITEVKNAITVYERLADFSALSINDFLKAHQLLMEGLVEDPGQWREKGVVVLKGTEVKHIAPPANRVPFLMADLFSFLTQEIALTWLLKACIFHYELEFIHPFSDGNGRMGRLWQQLLLMKEAPIFQYIPIEVLIKEHQQEYYRVLGECDAAGDSTLFIEFSLEQIVTALMAYINTAVPNSVSDVNTRLEYAKSKGIAKWFSRKDYMQLHKDISSATASRDLQQGVDMGLLTKRGEKNQVQYQFLK